MKASMKGICQQKQIERKILINTKIMFVRKVISIYILQKHVIVLATYISILQQPNEYLYILFLNIFKRFRHRYAGVEGMSRHMRY